MGVIALIALSMMLAACGGRGASPSGSARVSPSAGGTSAGGSPSASAPALAAADDPCKVVTRAEIATVTRVKVTKTTPQKGVGGKSEECLHQLQTGLVLVSVISPGAGFIDDLKTKIPSGDDVKGIGKRAYWGGGALAVEVGTRVVQVYVNAGEDVDSLAISKAIAKVAVRRMG
jgi:hypothetical protein